MSEEDWYGDPDHMPSMVDELPDCDYGISEFCEDPMSRYTGCTVNCWLYLQAVQEETTMMQKMMSIYNTWRILRSVSVGCMVGGFLGALMGNRIMLYWVAFFSVLLAVSSYMMGQAWRRLIGVIA